MTTKAIVYKIFAISINMAIQKQFKWGDKLIECVSADLKEEFSDIAGRIKAKYVQ